MRGSKHVFTLHGVDAQSRTVLRRNLSRAGFVEFFRKLPPLEVAMEACGGSHHWGRTLGAIGHGVRLIPAQYVKPFVRRGKTDAADAEAISEAAARPGMRAVPVKSAEQQARAMLLSVRELLVRQRTALVNALRGHVEPKGSPDAAEFGLVAPLGNKRVALLLAEAAQDAALPVLGTLSFAVRVEASQFRSGRHVEPAQTAKAASQGSPDFAAWPCRLRRHPSGGSLRDGLTPREHSSGGKQRLGSISRASDERLRQLLVLGSPKREAFAAGTTVIRHAKPGKTSPWLLSLLERKPRKLAAVALANKTARVI